MSAFKSPPGSPYASPAAMSNDRPATPLGNSSEEGAPNPSQTRYILVTGGVLSGVGKGVIASSIGVLCRAQGLHITHIKIDPYLNIDAGCMSPFEHGEVFVLDDGGEVDLDLGNYERFSDLTLRRENNITTGKIYQRVIEKERKGDYLGKTVQVVPHVTDEIQRWIQKVACVPVDGTDETPDVCIVELGGTVGDIESMAFVEALRQFQFLVSHSRFCVVHVSLVPTVGAGEQKSKPTQHSIKEMRGLGLWPDAVCCRSIDQLGDDVRAKVALAAHVNKERVLSVYNVSNLYKVVGLLESQGFVDFILNRLELHECVRNVRAEDPYSMERWNELAERTDRHFDTVRIALVGKYTGANDCYHSVVKALHHAAYAVGRKLELVTIESEDLQESKKETDAAAYHAAWSRLCEAAGVLVPGGFGDRGVEGKILAAKWARETRTPYLGVCLGMQLAVLEFARNVAGFENAQHGEMVDAATADEATVFAVVDMPEVSTTVLGGTMRLGSRPTKLLDPRSRAAFLYGGADTVHERHRHRYEVNPALVAQLEEVGMSFVGQDVNGERRMEVMELVDHPFFLGTQYHPEYKTRPLAPSPPYYGLLLAAVGRFEGEYTSWLDGVQPQM